MKLRVAFPPIEITGIVLYPDPFVVSDTERTENVNVLNVAPEPAPPVTVIVPVGSTEYDPGVKIENVSIAPDETVRTLIVAAVPVPPTTVRMSSTAYPVPDDTFVAPVNDIAVTVATAAISDTPANVITGIDVYNEPGVTRVTVETDIDHVFEIATRNVDGVAARLHTNIWSETGLPTGI